MREGHKAGREMRVGRKEGGLRALKDTVGINYKQELERACEGGGCLAVLPIYQYVTDLSR